MVRLCHCKSDICLKNGLCDNNNYFDSTSHIDRTDFGNNFGNLFTNKSKYENYTNIDNIEINNNIFDNLYFIMFAIILIYLFFIIYYRHSN